MSTALAIGAVTAILKGLLDNRLATASGDLGGSAPAVTVQAPDLVVPPDASTDVDRLNLFLYQVTPNLGWRNVGYPARDSQGDRVSCPPLALNLHYLLSAYSRVDFRAEIMLGYGMQLLHELGVLPRELIGARLVALTDPPENVLAVSSLAQQIEMLKITPEALSTEEISKLWAAFQTNYRPTAAYQVSVVLIESEYPARAALPVRAANFRVLPFKRPVIAAVQPQILEPGDSLTLTGQNLRADELRLRFGAEPLVTPAEADVTNRQISAIPPAGLLAGVNVVQVLHLIDFGTSSPSEPHPGFESNTVAFMLRPTITPPASVSAGSDLSLAVAPPVGRNQRAVLLLGDRALTVPQRSQSDPPTTGTLTIPIPDDFTPDTYLIRLRVDGAESRLTPDSGPFTGPTLQVTP
ncbi:MAG: DUF4255 domain-containing protein [Leptolyngbya sp. SIO4C5]|nr:DUF4255 domain-containing protein [Leptolyngbya sp. SIO4C5]